MEKIFFILILLIVISNRTTAQNSIKPIVIENHTGFDIKKYKQLFSDLDTTLIKTGFLIDKTFQLTPFANYNGSDTSKTISAWNWKILYSQIKESTVRSKFYLPLVDSIYKEDFHKEKIIPISVLDFSYEKIKDNAFENKLLKIADSKIMNVFSKNDVSPYSSHDLFAATVLKSPIFNGENATFLFDKSLYFTNKDYSNELFEIDFDDGLGFRKIEFGQKIQVRYNNIGKKIIRLKKTSDISATNQLQKTSQNRVFTSSFILQVSALFVPTYTFEVPLNISIPSNYPHGGGANVTGTAYVFTSDDSQNIKNPIIISDGFDPLNQRGIDSLYTMVNQQNMIECLRSQGYDFIILDFGNGGDYIERNAYLLKGLIEYINNIKVTQNKLVVIGTSMAGLVSRYALAYMEHQGINHDTRLYVSFDSPEKGANIPLGIQKWVKFFRA
ncbi:hypothetical protein AGMMS50262_23110 [Bacteroidia bacterium]|nr:hypothetical protein AGMMS50262_23110 [Bacteroidia bacterium]